MKRDVDVPHHKQEERFLFGALNSSPCRNAMFMLLICAQLDQIRGKK
jgi:hypothetical protein